MVMMEDKLDKPMDRWKRRVADKREEREGKREIANERDMGMG